VVLVEAGGGDSSGRLIWVEGVGTARSLFSGAVVAGTTDEVEPSPGVGTVEGVGLGTLVVDDATPSLSR
jgi:hypothetical protein